MYAQAERGFEAAARVGKLMAGAKEHGTSVAATDVWRKVQVLRADAGQMRDLHAASQPLAAGGIA